MRLPSALLLILIGLTAGSAPAAPHWTSLGPEGGTSDAVAVDPSNPLVVYSGNLGGVRKSTDGGATWSDASTGLERLPGVGTISIDPTDGSKLLVGGIFMSAGIHASTDGGAHWSEANFGLPNNGKIDAHRMLRDPGTPHTVYLASGDGFFKSLNGGTGWVAVGSGLSCGGGCVNTFAVDPAAPGTLYAGSYVDGVMKSTDGAVTFGPVGTGLPMGGPFAIAANAGAVYVGFFDGLYRSTDSGATFVASVAGLPASPVVNALAIDPTTPSTLYAGIGQAGTTATILYRSSDGGISWTATALPTAVPYSEANALTVDGSGCVVVGSVGTGVWRSCTGGTTWTNGTAGFRSVFANRVATDPGDAAKLYLATSGSGVQRTTDGGTTWVRTAYPEDYAGTLALAPSNPQIVYAIGGPGARSADGGATWTPCGPPGLAPPVVPFSLAVDPANPDTLYVGYYGNGFRKSTDGCATWAAASTGITAGADGRDIAIDPTNGQTLYGAAMFGGLYKSTDGAATWTKIGVGSVTYPFQVTIAPSDPSTLYAASYGFAYRSVDAGATWVQASGGLPPDGINHSALVVDPTRPLRVVLAGQSDFATPGGVWVSPDGGDVWNEVTGDLHDNDVVTLALDHLGQFLFAGNEGSGVHRLDVLCHADADCVDTNSCTADTCNPDDPTSDGFGCVHFQADPDCIDQCDNAADCQAGDLCSVWQCVPGDPDADPRGCVFTGDVQCANDACHEGFCDPDTGQCSSLPLTGVPCDDGDPCTTTDRCQAGVCVGAQEPVTACKASIVTGASTLSIRDASADTRDKLVFKFRKGPLAIPADFGDPFSAGGTGYATCLYDHSGPGGSSRLLASSRIDPAGTCNGRPCWSSKGVTLKYRNRAGQADGGIDTLQLLAGPDGHTRIALSAHGIALDAPAAPYTPAVTLQVRRTDTLTGCWGATFSTGIKLNGAAGFKGKSD